MPEAANKRFILVAETVWFLKLGEWLHEKWGKKYKVVHKGLPYFLLCVASLWDAQARTVKGHVGHFHTFDNSTTKGVLGIEFHGMQQSVCEMSETLIETGYVPRSKKK